jgi:uncharacterized membrane protein YcaP (DUF421 family)
MNVLFFDSWDSVFRTFVITILAYISMIILLRASGKRTLSKMNAFDFIITIALGSMLATVCMNKSVALLDGIQGFFLLIFLQYAITWLSVRYKKVKKLITSNPTLLVYKGEMLEDVMKRERITVEEVYVAVRKSGKTNLEDIYAIVLETTGTMNVIPESKQINENTQPRKQEALSGLSNFS